MTASAIHHTLCPSPLILPRLLCKTRAYVIAGPVAHGIAHVGLAGPRDALDNSAEIDRPNGLPREV